MGSYLWKFALLIIPVAIFTSGFGIYKFLLEIQNVLSQYDINVDSISPEIRNLFTIFDNNSDGYLEVNEFNAAIKHVLEDLSEVKTKEMVINESQIKDKLVNRTIPSGEEYATISAKFKPLDITTMSKYKNELGMDFMNDANIKGLQAWTEPFVKEANFPSLDFKVFLPSFDPKVGDIWEIVPVKPSKFERALSHNRVNPPVPRNEKEALLTDLLSMLQPKPFVLNRFGPQGSAAVLRAVNENYFDIVFRIHAEFQINDPPRYPFWFTPAQFAGRLIIYKNASHLEEFRMSVPNDKRLNVDMEWITGRKKKVEHLDDPWEMEVDIGYMPLMLLGANGPSQRLGEQMVKQEDIQWDEEISEWDARRLLQKRFYPFQEVEYLPFNETYKAAEKGEKLVHQIILWGSGRTLREGPLESLPITELLKKHFVSSWSLIAELQEFSNGEDEVLKNISKLCLKNYKFPVQSFVQYPDGRILSSLNANDLLDSTEGSFIMTNSSSRDFGDPVVANYFSFLEKGLKAAGKDE